LAEEIELRLRAEPELGLAQARAALADVGATDATFRVAYRLARRWSKTDRVSAPALD
jgi:hypothetical protein